MSIFTKFNANTKHIAKSLQNGTLWHYIYHRNVGKRLCNIMTPTSIQMLLVRQYNTNVNLKVTIWHNNTNVNLNITLWHYNNNVNSNVTLWYKNRDDNLNITLWYYKTNVNPNFKVRQYNISVKPNVALWHYNTNVNPNVTLDTTTPMSIIIKHSVTTTSTLIQMLHYDTLTIQMPHYDTIARMLCYP